MSLITLTFTHFPNRIPPLNGLQKRPTHFLDIAMYGFDHNFHIRLTPNVPLIPVSALLNLLNRSINARTTGFGVYNHSISGIQPLRTLEEVHTSVESAILAIPLDRPLEV